MTPPSRTWFGYRRIDVTFLFAATLVVAPFAFYGLTFAIVHTFFDGNLELSAGAVMATTGAVSAT